MRLHEAGMRSRKAGLALLVVALSALAVMGCGSDDGGGKANEGGKAKEGGKASQGPTKAEFTKKANAICKRHREKTAAAANKVLAGGRLPNPRQLGKLAMETVIPEYAAQTQELSRLKPPSNLTAEYEQFLAAARAAREKVMKNPLLLSRRESFEKVNGQAEKLGLSRDCHIGPA